MMTTLYVTEPYSVVKKDGDTLVVHIPANEKAGKEARKVTVPLLKIDQVVVLGDSSLTTQALSALLERKAEITFLTVYGQFRGRLVPTESRNGLLRLAQFRAHEDPQRRFDLARQFVQGKLHNQRTLLLRSNRQIGNDLVAVACESIRVMLDQIQGLSPDVEPPPDPERPQVDTALGSLQGLEGASAAQYFGAFSCLLRGDPALRFDHRTRRPPRDPVNALLSYGYTLLLHQCCAALQTVGLDTYIGYLHSAQYSKPALGLDMMEEFRAPVVDSVVLTLINNRILSAEDFLEELGGFRLKDRPRVTFLEKFEERLSAEIQHPIFGYKATYRRCLELQARLLAKALLGEAPVYPPFRVR